MFKVGDRVRIKASVKSPAYGWGQLKRSDVGVVKKVGWVIYIDFPSHLNWWGTEEDIDLVDILTLENI